MLTYSFLPSLCLSLAYALYTLPTSLLCVGVLFFLLLPELSPHLPPVPFFPGDICVLLMGSSVVNFVACLFLSTLQIVHPWGKEHVSALQEMLSFGWEGLVSWQCQSEDPPLLETNKIPLSVQLPVSSTESCAAQTQASCQGHMKS